MTPISDPVRQPFSWISLPVVRLGGNARWPEHGSEVVSGVSQRDRRVWPLLLAGVRGSSFWIFFHGSTRPRNNTRGPALPYPRPWRVFFHRAGYALSCVVVTKTDSGGSGFNY